MIPRVATFRRVTRDLRGAARSPAARPASGLAWIAWLITCRWSLPLLKRALPLAWLVRLVRWSAPRGDTETREERHRVLDGWWTAASPVLPSNCLERSLIVYGSLVEPRNDCALVVGFRKRGPLLEGHAWAALDGRPMMDTSEPGESFVPACAFDGSGRRVAGPAV